MRRHILLLVILLSCLAARGQTIIDLADIDLSGLPQPTTAKALRYWFNDDAATVQTASQLSGKTMIDVSGLMEGLHTLHYQVIDNEDGVAYVGSGLFLKVAHSTSLSVKSMRYWFDDDDSTVQTAAGTTGTYTLDVNGLTEGLHTLHYQLIDESGVAAYVGSGFFICTGSSIGSETVKAKKLMYWFDDETTMRHTDIGEGAQLVDASALIDGLHTLHYQVLCNNGQMTPAMSTLFLRVSADTGTTVAKNLLYWFDDEQNATETEITNGVQLLDASKLIEGLHTVHYQIANSNGTLGAPYSSIFLKMNWDTSSTTAKSLRYWYDDELTATETAISNGTQTLDAARLVDGLHTVHYQIVDSNGTLGAPASSVFLKMDASAYTTAKSLRYWFDDNAATVATTSVAGGTQTLDVSALSTGLHTLNYQLIDSKGRVTAPVTRLFMKNFDKVLADGYNRVTKYQYWLNMNSQAMQTVELDATANPYTLIALLPMQKEPIQSSQFHFEVTNDVPTIYAKNTLHVRFYDAQNYFTDGDKQFVDYSVKQEITEVDALVNGERKIVDSPVENSIRWFMFYAEEGDTVAFRTDQAATLQVFSPEGEEVYSAQGSTAVKYGGCHTWMDGTYCVALHDVTGSKPNISLDFRHLAKYDVVSYDVATVGNGGCSTITFKGNGFRDLYAVDFISASNDSIHSFSIGHESDGTTSVTADFTDAELGKYTVLFHFTEGKKYFYDAITVEEAKPIELATEVTFPRSFGHVVTYTCKITNNGNMTAYAVPIYTWLKSKTKDGIYHIEYDGLDLPGLFDGIGTDLLTEADIAELKASAKTLGDDHHFVKFWAKDEDNQEDSIYVRTNYFFTDIAPNETKTLRLTISTREVDAYAYFTVPEDWRVIHENDVDTLKQETRRMGRRASIGDYYCCYKTHLECFLERFATGCDIVAPILTVIGILQPELLEVVGPAAIDVALSGCMASLTNDKMKIFGKLFCASDSKGMKDAMDAIRNRHFSSSISVGSILSCVGATLSGLGANESCIKGCLSEAGFVIGGGALDSDFNGNTSCSQTGKKQPGCPPPPPGGGGAQGGKSHDPNEIYGYLAESGSKFMTDEVEKVNYRIEFENDTAFATRSAMVVEIRDTLDSNLFDLSSYAPTGIKIGEKSEYLDGEQNFVRTIDMRPEINGLVEVEGKYDTKKGIMTWLFTSIDPMTMEPTNDPMDGFLPVNTNGQGIGEVSYDIKLKQKMAEGTDIPNRASIVFDINEPILTPTWKNTIDATAPESHVTDVKMLNDSTATVSIEATDELSGTWRYNVYVQYGSGAWFLGAENVPIDTTASVKVYEGIDHGFYVVVTDSAGNVEQKEAAREFSFEVFAPQVDTNTKLQLAQGWNWISHNQQEVLSAEALKPKAQRIVSQTEELFKDSRFGWTGGLDELLPTELYKVQMAEADEVQLSGKLFNAAFRSMPLYEGWNWIGYPVANTMTPAEALQKTDAEEGDFIVGQDGMATFTNSQWTGTLIQMEPGLGYMYRSVSDKSLFLNATSQTSSRRANVERSIDNGQAVIPEDWTVDKRKYPNVMGLVAELVQDGEAMDANKWLVGAFCGEECRGLSQTVGGHMMINVYGMGGERISFMALNRECGEVMGVEESEPFRTDILGTIQQPYELHSGVVTGIAEMENGRWKIGDAAVYDLQGRRVEKSSMNSNGIYIVTDGNKIQKHVNHKRKK